MRVIAGSLRGRTLVSPPGWTTRPTADRVRTSLFDLLGAVPDGARVLDLFAGTGALGIEALSRGACHATFVENDATALKALRENLRKLGLEEKSHVLVGRAEEARFEAHGPYDLVLLDPPYESDLAVRLLPSVAASIGTAGVIALESASRSAETVAPRGFTVWKSRRYGRTRITLYSKEAL